jgi:cytochrome c-type biogenesis protein CcmH
MADMLTAKTGRIALVGAVALAVIAVGSRYWRETTPVPTAPGAEASADPRATIAKLEAELKAKPDDVAKWRELGALFFQSDRPGEAATAFRRATALDPAKAIHWSELGEALVAATPSPPFPADARAAFEKARAIEPKDPRARYFLAMARDMGGDHRGAIDDWITLLKDTPAGAPWEDTVRRTVEAVGKKNSIDVAPRLAALRPANPDAAQVAAAQDMSPQDQQAMIAGMVDRLAARLKAQPNDIEGWQMLMRSRVQLKQPDAARAALRDAKAANPGSTAALDATAKELGL